MANFVFNPREVAKKLEGNIPIILTVAHDGWKMSLSGHILELRRPERQNDIGTAELVRKVFCFLDREYSKRPYCFFQNIERKRLRREIIKTFYYEIFDCIRRCIRRYGCCYLLDMHCFREFPEIGNFDIIFGTNHRQTIDGDFDKIVASVIKESIFTDKNGYESRLAVYLPEEESKKGEKFAATKDFTLVKWQRDRLPVNALQVEMHADLLKYREHIDELVKIFSAVVISLI